MPKKTSFDLAKWVPVISISLSVIVAGIGWVAWIVRNVPQTSYVDELISKELKYIDLKYTDSTKYTDDKINSLRAEAFAHSDLNRGVMESEYKGLSAKIDMLIMMVQQNQGNRKK